MTLDNPSDNLMDEEEDMGQCDECQRTLWLSVHIFIMTNIRTEAEMTICSNCRHAVKWSRDWLDDEQLERREERLKKVEQMLKESREKNVPKKP